MIRILDNPRVLFWIALIAIIVNCSLFTLTRQFYGIHRVITVWAVFMDFFSLFGFLLTFYLFRALARYLGSVLN